MLLISLSARKACAINAFKIGELPSARRVKMSLTKGEKFQIQRDDSLDIKKQVGFSTDGKNLQKLKMSLSAFRLRPARRRRVISTLTRELNYVSST